MKLGSHTERYLHEINQNNSEDIKKGGDSGTQHIQCM